MPLRKTIFVNNEIYHLANRGVNHAPIFNNHYDYRRFINVIDFARYDSAMPYSHFCRLSLVERNQLLEGLRRKNELYVEILAFCLMPNHFHLLLKQLIGKGIQTFMSNFQNSYAKYFNARHERSGPLFQSAFKSVRIETDEQLNHVSRYIHLNPSSSYLLEIANLQDYKYSSLNDYLAKERHKFIEPAAILENFDSKAEYKKFVFDHAEYQRELDTIKHLTLED